jgi:hypothetical protein
MFTRLRKFLGNVLGTALYLIGWGLAVLVLAQAIILSVTTGSPLIPVILGVAGVIFFSDRGCVQICSGGTKITALGITGLANARAMAAQIRHVRSSLKSRH